MGEVALDGKYKIPLDRKTGKIARLSKRDKIIAISFKGGIFLPVSRERKFQGSLSGLGFVEERHEASRFMFRRKR